MLLVESNDHLNNLTQQGEGELVIENSQPARCLRLLDAEGLQLGHSEVISPPISLPVSVVSPRLVSSGEFSLLLDVGDASEEGIVHDQQLFLLGVDHIQLDEVGALIEGSLECLQGVLREDGAKTAVGDVERTASLVDVWSSVGLGLQED